MTAVTPVVFTTADGVERAVRSTFGSKKLIAEKYGNSKTLQQILNEQGDAAAIYVLWAMMHDEDGNPPSVSLRRLEFTIPPDDIAEVMAVIISALTQGKQSKNELTPLIEQAMEAASKLTGSGGGALPEAPSASPIPISGGSTPKRRSSRSLTDTENTTAS